MRNTNADTDSDSDSDRYSHSDSYSFSDSNSDAYGYCSAQSDADTKASPDSATSTVVCWLLISLGTREPNLASSLIFTRLCPDALAFHRNALQLLIPSWTEPRSQRVVTPPAVVAAPMSRASLQRVSTLQPL